MLNEHLHSTPDEANHSIRPSQRGPCLVEHCELGALHPELLRQSKLLLEWPRTSQGDQNLHAKPHACNHSGVAGPQAQEITIGLSQRRKVWKGAESLPWLRRQEVQGEGLRPMLRDGHDIVKAL